MEKLEEIIEMLSAKIADRLIGSNGDANESKDSNKVENVAADTDGYLTVKEFCSKLKISKSTYYRHKKDGYVKPAVYVGRKPLFDKKSIEDYLECFN